MRLSIHQINTKTLDFESNAKAMLSRLRKSGSESLSIFPELSLSGMPLFDNIRYDSTYKLSSQYSELISKQSQDMVFGAPLRIENKRYNSLVFIEKGELIGISRKKNLGIYDQGFDRGEGFSTLRYKNNMIGFGFLDDFLEVSPKDSPKLSLIILSSNNVFSLSSRTRLLKDLIIKARQHSCPIVFLNNLGSEGGSLFSGHSFVLNSRGELAYELALFEEESKHIIVDELKPMNNNPASKYETIYKALVFAVKDYFAKNNIPRAMIGLSGGIDSALVASLVKDALGAENLMGLILPSEFSSSHSIKDAQDLVHNLGIEHHIISIEDAFNLLSEDLSKYHSSEFSVADENIQSRIRCNILMWFANKLGAGLFNTTNKSEFAVGYGTLYGDTSGAMSLLGDLLKTEVWELSKWINREKEIIPWNSIHKPPSAELRPDQKDTDSLPDYSVLDKIITEFLERRITEEEIVSENNFDEALVNRTLRLIRQNEWKRRQCPIPIKISDSCFGIDIKFPLT